MLEKYKIWMAEAEEYASLSKDINHKVGCIIVEAFDDRIGYGYNRFPRYLDDTIQSRYERPQKYDYTEHAERNAIYMAARNGKKTFGCTMVVTWFPCIECTRAIIECGISKVVCRKPDFSDDRWGRSFTVAHDMLTEAGIEIIYID